MTRLDLLCLQLFLALNPDVALNAPPHPPLVGDAGLYYAEFLSWNPTTKQLQVKLPGWFSLDEANITANAALAHLERCFLRNFTGDVTIGIDGWLLVVSDIEQRHTKSLFGGCTSEGKLILGIVPMLQGRYV